jgi:hypothetical protein
MRKALDHPGRHGVSCAHVGLGDRSLRDLGISRCRLRRKRVPDPGELGAQELETTAGDLGHLGLGCPA